MSLKQKIIDLITPKSVKAEYEALYQLQQATAIHMQIAQERVADLEDVLQDKEWEIRGLQEDNDDLNCALDNKENEIYHLEQEVYELNHQIDELSHEVQELEYRLQD